MTTSQHLPTENKILSFFQPATAWVFILGLSLLTALLIAVGAGRILNIAFPIACTAVAVYLYSRAPLLYVGFSWWVWFLAAFVRRLADFRSAFTDPSPILVAPYLVSLVSILTLIRYVPKTRDGMPFVLGAIGVAYGALLGLVSKEPFVVAKSVLDWLAPISFGFHLFMHWREYPQYRSVIQRSFVWGIFLMGIYGVYQFVSLPEWDRKWLIDTTLISAAGDPDQEAPRIWSTMQSGEPFAGFMAGALLLLLTSKGPMILPASAAGYLAFLLAMVRSGWLGWAAGLLALGGALKPKFQIRLITTVLIMALCIVPLATMEPFADRIQARISTLGDVQSDSSAQGRQAGFKDSIGPALETVVGEGLGGGTMDNGILATLFYLGWFGTIPYFGGMLLLLIRLFQCAAKNVDPFVGTSLAVVMTAVVRLPANGAQFGISGTMIWGFLAMGLAADKYYRYQQAQLESGHSDA